METTHLILRKMQESDAADFFAYAKNVEVGPRAGWQPHQDEQETVQIMRQVFLGRENTYGIIDKKTKRLIGTIGLASDPLRTNDMAQALGYSIAREYWGKGYTTEAAKAVLEDVFVNKKLPFITATHYRGNQGSKRVIEKCHFQYEGTLRQAEKRYDGAVFDLCCYSLSREEYLRQ